MNKDVYGIKTEKKRKNEHEQSILFLDFFLLH